jgi:hypothetical protein
MTRAIVLLAGALALASCVDGDVQDGEVDCATGAYRAMIFSPGEETSAAVHVEYSIDPPIYAVLHVYDGGGVDVVGSGTPGNTGSHSTWDAYLDPGYYTLAIAVPCSGFGGESILATHDFYVNVGVVLDGGPAPDAQIVIDAGP